MNTHISKFPQSLMWVAGAAITLFCATGIAAFTGWIPNSMGRSAQDSDFAVSDRPSPAESRTIAVNATPTKPGASTTQRKAARCPGCGRVESVEQVTTKDIATVIGPIGGVMAGNEIEKRARATTGYDITLRMNDGSTRVIHQLSQPAWRTGDPVKLVSGSLQSN